MKIREALDKLDEINRRDFLKGAGVAALASLSSNALAYRKNPFKMNDKEIDALVGAMQLYYFINNGYIKSDSTELMKGFKRLSDLDSTLFNERFLNEIYYDVEKSLLKIKQRDPKKFNDGMLWARTNQRRIIDKLSLINPESEPFGELKENSTNDESSSNNSKLSRRDFLKGTGAAAAGTLGVSKNAKSQTIFDTNSTVDFEMLTLYYFSRTNFRNVARLSDGERTYVMPESYRQELDLKYTKNIQDLIDRFNRATFLFNGRAILGKEILSNMWPTVKETIDNLKESNPFRYASLYLSIIDKADKIIEKFQSLIEFQK